MKKLCILLLIIFVSIIIFSYSVRYRNDILDVGNIPSKQNKTIIIDAGHGGFDGGTSSNDGLIEKDVNLKIALYLNEYLSLMGYKTVLTREADVSLEDEGLTSIRQRKTSDIHNRFNLTDTFPNSIFISIHQNHFSQEKYNGMQVFYSPNNSQESSKLADNIQSTTVDFLQPQNTRQIKPCTTSVYLIYNAVVPSVLVECGFLSNKEEASLLSTDKYQKQVAYSIAIGIINYINYRD